MAYGFEAVLTTSALIISLINSVIMIFLGAWLLQLTAKLMKLKDKGFATAFRIALILGIIGIVWTVLLLITLAFAMVGPVFVLAIIVVALFLIKGAYNLDWSKTIIVAIIWAVFSIIASGIINAILGLFM